MAAYRTDVATWNATSGNKTAVITSAVGDVFVVFVGNVDNTANATVSDDQVGGTYTRILSELLGGSTANMSVFVRNNPFNVAASTTVTMAIGATSGGGLDVIAVSGMYFGGAACVRQSAGQANQASGTPTPVFGAAALTGNMCLGCVIDAANPAGMTPTASWTERRDLGFVFPAGMETQTRDSGFTGTSVAWGNVAPGEFGDIVIELDATPPWLGTVLEYA